MRNSTLNAVLAQALAGALALLTAPWALALSLGEAIPQSALGQPLRVAVPISAGAAQALPATCVRVTADAAADSGPARLLTDRVTIDRGAAESLLWVTTTRPVNEPVVRLSVQAGCNGTTRRDYVLLLDPPSAKTARSIPQRPEVMPVVRPNAIAQPSEVVPVALSAPSHVARARSVAASATVAGTAAAPPPLSPTIIAAPADPEPTTLSSSAGRSFISEAAAAGLPRTSSSQTGLSVADPEPVVAPWWPLATALLIVAALARWLVPMRRRSAVQPPAWVTPTARTEPNPSVIAGHPTASAAGKPGYFAAMTEPGTGFPRGASRADRGGSRADLSAARTDPTPSKPTPTSISPASARDDSRFASFDADLVEEQTIRAEWAKAVTDGAIDIGGDSILKAIDDAERAIQGGPAHPAQVALDRSLDDELLPNKPSR